VEAARQSGDMRKKLWARKRAQRFSVRPRKERAPPAKAPRGFCLLTAPARFDARAPRARGDEPDTERGQRGWARFLVGPLRLARRRAALCAPSKLPHRKGNLIPAPGHKTAMDSHLVSQRSRVIRRLGTAALHRPLAQPVQALSRAVAAARPGTLRPLRSRRRRHTAPRAPCRSRDRPGDLDRRPKALAFLAIAHQGVSPSGLFSIGAGQGPQGRRLRARAAPLRGIRLGFGRLPIPRNRDFLLRRKVALRRRLL
jgi:hypothetical protein